MRLPNVREMRVGVWTLHAMVRCRRQIGAREPEHVTLPDSSNLPTEAGQMVVTILSRRKDQCLSNALITQAWRADHGDPVDVLIGVNAPSAGFTAHAWLEDRPDAGSIGLEPIHRITPKFDRSHA